MVDSDYLDKSSDAFCFKTLVKASMESSGSHRCWSLSKHVSSDTFSRKLW